MDRDVEGRQGLSYSCGGDGVSEIIFKCRECNSKSYDYKVTDDEGTTIHDIECTECGGDYNYEYCHSCCPCGNHCGHNAGSDCDYWDNETDCCELGDECKDKGW